MLCCELHCIKVLNLNLFSIRLVFVHVRVRDGGVGGSALPEVLREGIPGFGGFVLGAILWAFIAKS